MCPGRPRRGALRSCTWPKAVPHPLRSRHTAARTVLSTCAPAARLETKKNAWPAGAEEDNDGPADQASNSQKRVLRLTK